MTTRVARWFDAAFTLRDVVRWCWRWLVWPVLAYGPFQVALTIAVPDLQRWQYWVIVAGLLPTVLLVAHGLRAK